MLSASPLPPAFLVELPSALGELLEEPPRFEVGGEALDLAVDHGNQAGAICLGFGVTKPSPGMCSSMILRKPASAIRRLCPDITPYSRFG